MSEIHREALARLADTPTPPAGPAMIDTTNPPPFGVDVSFGVDGMTFTAWGSGDAEDD